MEFYLDEKQRKKRRRILKLKIFATVTVFLFLLSGFFYLIAFSQIFKIKSIFAVSENAKYNLEADKLVGDLKNFFVSRSKISKFLGGDNILVWSGGISDFLKTQPIFSVLEINKNYFKREISIKFEKRERYGVWCQKNAACWWIDKNGIVFEKAPKVEGEMILKVNDNSDQQLDFGKGVLRDDLFKNLIKIFEILQKTGINIKTLYIENLALEEIEARPLINSIPQIYFSLRLDPAFALSAIKSFKKIGLNKIKYIDFRIENRVYYKLK
ncbi:hypothetical protein HZC33_02105 [Candidatus Wolfebacteria bacterium]|nr:hypothetical protein [Candidatus Wolfebacteria bacterium]